MVFVLEIKEKLKEFYSKYGTYLEAVFRFALTFLTLYFMDREMGGYFQLVDQPILIFLAAALVCAIFPQGLMVIVCGGYLLLQMWGISMEATLVLAILFFLMFTLYFVFKPGNSWIMVLTMLFCFWKIPTFVFVVLGMLFNPFCIVPISFAMITNRYLDVVNANATGLSSSSSSELVARISLLVNGFTNLSEMWLLIVAAAVTVCIVYLIRRLSVSYSWTIAAVAGTIIEIIIVLAGSYALNIPINLVGALMGAGIGLLFLMLMYFFVYSLDYSRIEYVQFEDDEYFYYVKAVPKLSVAKQHKDVKTINKRVENPTTPVLDENVLEEAEEEGEPSAQTAAAAAAAAASPVVVVVGSDPMGETGEEFDQIQIEDVGPGVISQNLDDTSAIHIEKVSDMRVGADARNAEPSKSEEQPIMEEAGVDHTPDLNKMMEEDGEL